MTFWEVWNYGEENSSAAACGLRMGEGFDYKEAVQLFFFVLYEFPFSSPVASFPSECFPPVFYPLAGEPSSLL